MKRRDFIGKSVLGVVGTTLVPQFLKGMNFVGLPSGAKRLIVIQLSGGNDGLNTVIPYENDIYYKLRPQIAIAKNEVLKLNDQLGLNPAMIALHELFKEGMVSVINAVGYPNPNRSHFRSMDIWHTATDSNKYAKQGWLGNYIDNYCSNAHAALEIDSQLSLSMQGKNRSGLAVKRSDSLYKLLRKPYFNTVINKTVANDLEENGQGYLYKTLIQTNESARYLAEKHVTKDNNADFPASKLGKKLGTVSQFIRSGFSTQVYYVSHNGFDSHANQVNSQGRLLKDYANGVHALVRSLEKSGDMDDTLILTFSEFGRRVKENASRGTDHGKANNLFLIGKQLKRPGVANNAADLLNLDNGDVPFSVDFRNIYQDVIADWFQQDPRSIISTQYPSLGII